MNIYSNFSTKNQAEMRLNSQGQIQPRNNKKTTSINI